MQVLKVIFSSARLGQNFWRTLGNLITQWELLGQYRLSRLHLGHFLVRCCSTKHWFPAAKETLTVTASSAPSPFPIPTSDYLQLSSTFIDNDLFIDLHLENTCQSVSSGYDHARRTEKQNEQTSSFKLRSPNSPSKVVSISMSCPLNDIGSTADERATFEGRRRLEMIVDGESKIEWIGLVDATRCFLSCARRNERLTTQRNERAPYL